MLGPGEDPSVLEPEVINSLQDYKDSDRSAYELMFRKLPKGLGHEVKRLDERELKYVLNETKFGLISAGPNEHLDPKGATKEFYKERSAKLEQELIEAGYVYTPVVGHFFGEEDSFLVMAHDADREEIKQMGARFNQQSVIFSDKGKNEMIQVTDGDNPKGSVWSATGYTVADKETMNLYTEFPVRGYKIIKIALDTGYYGDNPPHRKEMKEGWVTLDDGRRILIGYYIQVSKNIPKDIAKEARIKTESILSKIPEKYRSTIQKISIVEPKELVRPGMLSIPYATYQSMKNGQGSEILINVNGFNKWSSEDIEATIKHEVGHNILTKGMLDVDSEDLWLKYDLDIRRAYDKDASVYKTMNVNKFSAQSWAEHFCESFALTSMESTMKINAEVAKIVLQIPTKYSKEEIFNTLPKGALTQPTIDRLKEKYDKVNTK